MKKITKILVTVLISLISLAICSFFFFVAGIVVPEVFEEKIMYVVQAFCLFMVLGVASLTVHLMALWWRVRITMFTDGE